jgi:hypothetical protein
MRHRTVGKATLTMPRYSSSIGLQLPASEIARGADL